MDIRLLTLIIVLSTYASSVVSAVDQRQANELKQPLRIIEAQPLNKHEDLQSIFLKGATLYEDGMSKEAEAIFYDLTIKYPAMPEPYNNLAVIYAEQGNFEKAERALGKAINMHRIYSTMYKDLAPTYSQLAIQIYDNVMKLVADYNGSQIQLSMISGLQSLPARK